MFCKSTFKYMSVLCIMLIAITISGVFATWNYAASPEDAKENFFFGLGSFIYVTEEMPKGQVTLIERLDDILNQRYTTDIVIDARDYLINETIQVRWEEYAPPYVGSMDTEYDFQINELFGDVILDENVSFILKNQDLNWDGFSEISLYSTSDPLDCIEEYDGVVCVYVTVFAPIIDENKNIIGYSQICDSLHGYCCEVWYKSDNPIPSFSTDEWRNDIGYYHIDGNTYVVPYDAMSVDGSKPFRYDHASYTREYSYENCPWPGRTLPLGKKLTELIWDKIPWLE